MDALSTYSNTSCKENHPRAPLLLLLIAKYEKLHILDEIKPDKPDLIVKKRVLLETMTDEL